MRALVRLAAAGGMDMLRRRRAGVHRSRVAPMVGASPPGLSHITVLALGGGRRRGVVGGVDRGEILAILTRIAHGHGQCPAGANQGVLRLERACSIDLLALLALDQPESLYNGCCAGWGAVFDLLGTGLARIAQAIEHGIYGG